MTTTKNSKNKNILLMIKSMIKWVMANPNFSLIDKIEFFAFYFGIFLTPFLFFWFAYTNMADYTNRSILPFISSLTLFILFVILIKYFRQFHKKFSIAYFESIGETELAAKYESGGEFAREWIVFSTKTFFKLYALQILFLILLVVVIILTHGTKYFTSVFLGFWAVVIFFIFRLIYKWQQSTWVLIEKYDTDQESFANKTASWQKKRGIFIDVFLGVITFLIVMWIYSIAF